MRARGLAARGGSLTHPSIHIFRLLKWGRVLARHGALRGIEKDRNAPAQVKRLCRIARLGTRQPREPDYAGAFQEIGPAAIKLGQALATRPDLVGEGPAHNLLTLQDNLPPVAFPLIRERIEQSFGKPIDALFASFEEEPIGAASIAQVHRAVTSDGRHVAVKVLRPHIRERFARDVETYEWAAAHVEAIGGEAERLRPRAVIDNLKRWTVRELDLRREAASASELAEAMKGVHGYCIPGVDWDRTNGSVLTVEWVDGIKMSDLEALRAAGHDLPALARTLVLTFLKQAISTGFFHADMHQGNLFVTADGTIVAIDFGIMGRINRQARLWLAEILYGLTTGNYRRVAEIHFEAQYVPSYHTVEEFATALDPKINMWDVSGPFVKDWIRDELGPEAVLADRLREDLGMLMRLPDLVRRIEERFPPKGGAPEQAPLPEVDLIWGGRVVHERVVKPDRNHWARYALAAVAGGIAAWAVTYWSILG